MESVANWQTKQAAHLITNIFLVQLVSQGDRIRDMCNNVEGSGLAWVYYKVQAVLMCRKSFLVVVVNECAAMSAFEGAGIIGTAGQCCSSAEISS